MTRLADVERVYVPSSLALEAHAYLQAVGARGLEGMALWAGRITGRAARVTATCIPAQRGLRTEQGLAVVIDGDELHRLNQWLYQQGLMLIAQLHNHPGRAYHSDTDDAFPIATRAGSLSLVVPDHARDPFDLARCAIYRLRPDGVWYPLTAPEVSHLIVIEGSE